MAKPTAVKTTHLATLSCLLLLVFIASSLVPFKLIDDSTPSKQLGAGNRSNITEIHRFLRLEDHLTVIDRKHNFAFALRSGTYPDTHPSQPYYVMSNEAGEYLQTIEDGHPDHPLSRLLDFREPRDAEREAVFFFVVPKVWQMALFRLFTPTILIKFVFFVPGEWRSDKGCYLKVLRTS